MISAISRKLNTLKKTYPANDNARIHLAYTRDNAGQVTTVTTTQPSMSPVNLATSVTHLPFGPVKSLTWGNGVTDTRTFDLDYRMTSVKGVGTGNIQYVSYGYDADDNLLTWTDNVTAANNQTLAYDVLSRISYASGPYGTVSSITYDSNSNRTAYGATGYTVPSTSNKMSNAGGSSVTYTNAGNIKAIGSDTFFFNKENQLSQATVSGTVTTFPTTRAGTGSGPPPAPPRRTRSTPRTAKCCSRARAGSRPIMRISTACRWRSSSPQPPRSR